MKSQYYLYLVFYAFVKSRGRLSSLTMKSWFHDAMICFNSFSQNMLGLDIFPRWAIDFLSPADNDQGHQITPDILATIINYFPSDFTSFTKPWADSLTTRNISSLRSADAAFNISYDILWAMKWRYRFIRYCMTAGDKDTPTTLHYDIYCFSASSLLSHYLCHHDGIMLSIFHSGQHENQQMGFLLELQ